MKIKHFAAAFGCAAVVLLSGNVAADDMVNNFVTSSGGSFIKNSAGNCWRTRYQDSAEKPVECGYPAPEPEVVMTQEVEVVAAPTAATLTTMAMEKIELAAVMLFGFDSADLTDDAKAVIDERVARLRGEVSLTSAMRIEGHTDSTGAEAYNLALSERRAQAVANYIIDETRLTAADIEIMPMGESSPVASNDTAEGRAENRRVTLFAQGEVGQ